MKTTRFFSYFLLSASLLVSTIGRSKADEAPAPTAKYRTICNCSGLRKIEVITDRDETVAQFFARQKLVLVNNANTDGKMRSVGQIVSGKAPQFFASYPLGNDQGFRLYSYGDFYNLEKPAPAVAALFTDDLAQNWSNTLLILAPLAAAKQISLDISDVKHPNARLVGRVLVKDREKWRPEIEADALKYQESKAKTK